MVSNFRLVLNVEFIVLGDTLSSEFYLPDVSKRSASVLFVDGVSRKNNRYEIFWGIYMKKSWLEISLSQSEERYIHPIGSGYIRGKLLPV